MFVVQLPTMKRFSLLTLLLACATGLFAQDDCPNPYDGNDDGMVNIPDLLDLLALFGDFDTDVDGVWDSADDCVDPEACNYTANPTETCLYIDALDVCGGACEGDEDGDGICDDVDTCVGIEDECGECNGPGPTEIVIDEIITTYDSIFLPVDEEWFVFAAEVDTVFSYTCAPSFASCGDPVSYQGYDYATVQIGDQCWFAENLRNENYRNGDSIPSDLSFEEWIIDTTGSVALMGEGNYECCCINIFDGDEVCDENWLLSEYGRLYNWYGVDDDRRLCPAGWHVPSDGEWMRLENSLGMPASDLNVLGVRGSDQAIQMKMEYGWDSALNGSNSSGFSALPAGYRTASSESWLETFGGFWGVGVSAYWWSSTSPNDSSAWSRSIWYEEGGVGRGLAPARAGYSVRCVQDGLICEADEDEDGICDDLDDCVGEFDACGVCNGPGAIYDCGCEECPAFECGDPTTYQGYDYATVQIGDHCWFAENLRSENYDNGDAIPANLSNSEWSSTTSGAVAVYGEGSSTCGSDSPDGNACDEAWSLNEYGRLYNWYAVDDARGLCPSGWHVPTDEEWMTLEMALGMSEAEANSLYYRGTNQGEQMKTDYGWEGGFNGTNASGFSGLPGGGRRYDGNFFGWAGTRGFWWTSSPSGSNAYWRQLNQDFNGVDRQGYLRRAGLSVRCVQDTE